MNWKKYLKTKEIKMFVKRCDGKIKESFEIKKDGKIDGRNAGKNTGKKAKEIKTDGKQHESK